MKQLESYEKQSKKRGDRHAEEDSDEEGEGEGEEELSIGDFVKREGLSDAFRDDYLLVSSTEKMFGGRSGRADLRFRLQPMTAAIWSTPPDKCGLGELIFTPSIVPSRQADTFFSSRLPCENSDSVRPSVDASRSRSRLPLI